MLICSGLVYICADLKLICGRFTLISLPLLSIKGDRKLIYPYPKLVCGGLKFIQGVLMFSDISHESSDNILKAFKALTRLLTGCRRLLEVITSLSTGA
jgi:hypothetical protein